MDIMNGSLKTEEELIRIAQCGNDDDATNAMIELREHFDSTYVWCSECDYAVVKFSNCCLERAKPNDSI